MLVPIDKIIVDPNRHRKIFEQKEIDSLAESIKAVGLLHPPVVRRGEGDTFILMAGERRLRALKQLYGLVSGEFEGKIYPNIIPVTLFEDVDPILAKEIELEENLRRVDLSWKETAAATAELHKMRKEADPNWNTVRTAEEIKERGGATLNPTVVRNRVLLAENMSRPEVAEATSESQAMKNLARVMENEFRAAMAKQMIDLPSQHRLELIDAVSGIRQLTAGTVDVVITDPPYGINASDFNIPTVTETHRYEDDWSAVESLLADTIVAISAVCKEQSHVYMFVDFSHWAEIKEMFELNEWEVWNRPLIWCKNTGYTPRPDYGPRRNYETIMYAFRGRKMVTGVYSDVLQYAAEPQKEHAAQKPLAVYTDLLKRSVTPGDLILDPFCGSGVVFDAAKALNLRAVGFDNDPAAFQIARGKL